MSLYAGQRKTSDRERLKFRNIPAIAPAATAQTGSAAQAGTNVTSTA